MLVAAGIEYLKVDEQRPRYARAPPDDDVAVGQSGGHRNAVQPGDGVGAKLGAGLFALQSETLRADALVGSRVGPNGDEPAVAETRHSRSDEGLHLGRADLDLGAGQRVAVEGPEL